MFTYQENTKLVTPEELKDKKIGEGLCVSLMEDSKTMILLFHMLFDSSLVITFVCFVLTTTRST